MHRNFLAAILFALPLFGQPAAVEWHTLPWDRVEVDGLPWYQENKGEFLRLPLRVQEAVPAAVWNLAHSPSGARIRLRTDSRLLSVRLEYPSPPNMRNMHAFGQTGVDAYVNGIYLGTAIADQDAKPGKVYEHQFFDFRDRPKENREITLYLSLYKPVKVLAIGLDRDAAVARAAPFAVPRPVVFYGTSITQGGCASRPGMSYQAILGRALNLDFVNLGFSGAGKGEPAVASAVAEIDAACFVLDFAQNNKAVDSLREVYDPFLQTLRNRHADTPIVAITPIASAREVPGGPPDERIEAMRRLIRDVVTRRISQGDRHLQLVEGTDLLGPGRLDGLVDGVHPNDLGFQWMADDLGRRLMEVLRLTPHP
ncbi:MAG TPA: SGNH/GDSL hydrolase family protein [Bryobacteraceae bacterium]|nr:SGNH/GDSL hydrolase family protein [Bryobacteraceae bacterium]